MIWLLSLFIFSAHAQNTAVINSDDFSFTHPTCLVRFDNSQEFANKISVNLKDKGFKLQDYIEGEKLNPEDMYLSLTIKREGWFFKDCELDLKIMEAKSSKRLSTDRTLLESKTVRAYPRVTFSGDERCTRGIDDLFIDIPKCTSGALLNSDK